MKVFISWSGKGSRSHRVAELLRSWLPKVIQRLPCFMSSSDIDAGAVWLNTLMRELEGSAVGIICLTKASLDKPWLLFEAGALSKAVDTARVCPLLIDVTASGVLGPLGAFQMKTTQKEDMLALLTMVNAAQKNALPNEGLLQSFDVWWKEFVDGLTVILAETKDEKPETPERQPDPVQEEILSLVRTLVTIAAPSFDPRDPNDIWRSVIKVAKAQRPTIVPELEKANEVVFDGSELLVILGPDSDIAGISAHRSWIEKTLQGFGIPGYSTYRQQRNAPGFPKR